MAFPVRVAGRGAREDGVCGLTIVGDEGPTGEDRDGPTRTVLVWSWCALAGIGRSRVGKVSVGFGA
jgi:hypothetical protein